MAKRRDRKADSALLMALACGATVENAARSANMSERTAYRRLEDPEFRRQLQEARTEMVRRTANTLTAAAMESVKTLLSLQQTSQPPSVRLGAARAVIELGTKLRDSADLAERVADLEDQMRHSRPVT